MSHTYCPHCGQEMDCNPWAIHQICHKCRCKGHSSYPEDCPVCNAATELKEANSTSSILQRHLDFLEKQLHELKKERYYLTCKLEDMNAEIADLGEILKQFRKDATKPCAPSA